MPAPKKKVSIIIPAFNEEGNIHPIYSALSSIFNKRYNYEIIFIDDGSIDKTLKKIEQLSSKDKRVKYLSFSRNFGHQNALRAGLASAKGDCAISLDADLRHPVSLIPKMLEKWEQGYEIVKSLRQDNIGISWWKRITALAFYKILRFVARVPIEMGSADFRLLDRIVIDNLHKFTEHDLFLRGMLDTLGFRKYALHYDVQERHSGQTKYSLFRMINFALSGITSLSIQPLRISALFGFFCFVLTMLYTLYVLYVHFYTEETISAWTSMILVLLFTTGLQMILLGIIGEYLGRLFLEAKNRPSYIIQKKNF